MRSVFSFLWSSVVVRTAVALCLVVGILISQTRLSVVKQIVVDGALPGQFLVVGADGRSVVTATVPPSTTTLFGSGSQPNCTLVAGTNDTYQLPVVPKSVAVMRNGLTASMPNEFTITGDRIKITNPILNTAGQLDEVVVCHLTY